MTAMPGITFEKNGDVHSIDTDITPSESTVSSSDGKLRAIFEDLLDHKLQLLEDRLLQEFVGIRADLLEKSIGQHSDVSLVATSCCNPGKTATTCSKSHQTHRHHLSEAHETDPGFGRDGDVVHRRPLRSETQCTLQSQDSKQAGVHALVTKEATQPQSQGVRAIPQQLVDKFKLRNELATMRKERAVYHDGLLAKLQLFAEWWQDLNEPERQGWIASLVKARSFEGMCILVIIVNSLFIAVAADWEVRHTSQDKPSIFFHAEVVCSVFFIIELLLRLYVHRLYFFVNDQMKINCFDFSIVVLGCLDLMCMVTEETNVGPTKDNFALGRMARLLKLSKMFRTMRALRFFKDLVVIMESVANSLAALFWIFIMLGIMLFVCALVFVQGTIDYLHSMDGKIEEQELMVIQENFGSMWATAMSMYCAVTGGNDWLVYYEIIAKFGAVYAALFLGFLFFFMFAMFNILTGLFVEKAAVASKPDEDHIILTEKRKFFEHSSQLHSLCVMLDADETGCIAWEDFERMMSNPTVVACMSSIGLEVHEPESFFKMICGNREDLTIPIDLFVDSCMQMKGSATSIDAQRSLFELCQIRRQLELVAGAVFAGSSQSQYSPTATQAASLTTSLSL